MSRNKQRRKCAGKSQCAECLVLEARIFLDTHSLASIPVLNSYPSAYVQIYLDFDGDPARTWNGYNVPVTPAFDTDGDPTTFSDQELASIQEIWARVAEKYSPFNVNVTTVRPADFSDRHALHLIIGGNALGWNPSLPGGIGGVSEVGDFSDGVGTNVYVFPPNLSNNPKPIAECAAHESGHAFYLQHQSTWVGSTKTEYSTNGGSTLKAPIMGNSYGAARGLWWYGTSSISSASIQDDLYYLTFPGVNLDYRPQDHGQSIATADALTVNGTTLTGSGVIAQTTDTDYFSFTTPAGSVIFNVNVAQYGPMLDAAVELRDSSGTVLASADTASLGETITYSIPTAGTYYLVVKSHGCYGDIGQYTVSGTIPAGGSAPFAEAGGPYTVAEGGSVQLNGSASTGTGLTYAWDLDGDGIYGETGAAATRGDETGATPTFLATGLDGPGTYTVSLRVTDGSSNTATDTATINITNVAPTVSITGAPSYSAQSTAITLGTSIYDPGASDTQTVTWAVTKNGSAFTSGSGTSFTFTPNAKGTYVVTATDTDKDGGVGTDSKTIAVTQIATVAIPTGLIGTRGNAIIVPVQITNDADGLMSADLTITYNTSLLDLANADVSLSTYLAGLGWSITPNVNDTAGTARISISTNGSALAAGAADLLNLTFHVPGAAPAGATSLAITGTLNEGNLAMTPSNGALTVPIAVSVTGNPGSGPEGTAITLGSTISGQQGAATYAWSVTKDGSSFTLPGGTITNASTFTCTPTDDGSYVATLLVTDSSSDSGSATASMTISNVAPTASIGNSGPIGEGGSATVTLAGASDPSSVDTSAGFHYSFALTQGALLSAYAAAGTSTSAPFTFADNGSYTVWGRIFDKDNGSTDYSTTVTVSNVAPTASISNNGPVGEGSSATVTLAGASDPSSADTTAGFHYSFALTQGALLGTYAAAGTSTSAPFTFADNGSFTVWGRIFDKDNGSTDYSTTVTVSNVAPTASIGNSGPINEGGSATVSLSSPSDPSSADTTAGFHYSFALTQGALLGTYAAAGTSTSAPFTFTDNGSFTVWGRIFDKDNGSTDYSTTVVVDNVAPTASIGNSGSINEGGSATVSLAGASDPSSADTTAGCHYSFALTQGALLGTYAAAGTSTSAPFTFNDNGSFTVWGRIFDKDNGSTDYSTTVVVDNVAPTASASNNGPVGEGTPVTVTLAGASDPSSADTTAGFHYSFALTQGALLGTYAAAGTSTSAPFTFSDNGSYTVWGRIFDKDNGSTDYSTTVVVDNVAPTASIGNSGPIGEGSPATVTLSSPSDPSSVDTSAGFHYSFATTQGRCWRRTRRPGHRPVRRSRSPTTAASRCGAGFSTRTTARRITARR